MIFSSLSKYMLKYQKAKAKLVEYDVAYEDYPKFNRDSNTLVYSTIYILSKYAEGVLTNDESIKSEFAPLLISMQQRARRIVLHIQLIFCFQALLRISSFQILEVQRY